MRVLVTGASGYSGTRLVEAILAQGHSVRALVHTPAKAPPLRALGARVQIGDLTRPATIAGITANMDVIYHLAGTLAGGATGMRQVIVEGTRNLIEQCLVSGSGSPLQAFVSAGNAAIYGDGHGMQLAEGTACRPTYPLGSLNLQAEELLRSARAEHGLPVIILRLGAVYGPERLSSSLVRDGRFRIVGSGRNFSSRIHVDDLVSVLLALREGAPHALYCVADEEPSPVCDYYGALAALMGVPPPRRIPVWAARARAMARDGAALRRGRLSGTSASIIGLFTSDQRLDGRLIRADLGLRFCYPSYREGLPASLAMEAGSSSMVEATLMAR